MFVIENISNRVKEIKLDGGIVKLIPAKSRELIDLNISEHGRCCSVPDLKIGSIKVKDHSESKDSIQHKKKKSTLELTNERLSSLESRITTLEKMVRSGSALLKEETEISVESDMNTKSKLSIFKEIAEDNIKIRRDLE